MKGEISVINKYLLDHPDNLITRDIGKVSKGRIIEVINDEFWKEFRHRIDYSEDPALLVPGLGVFSVQYGTLKGYIRRLIKQIRKTRQRIEKLKLKKSFDPENSMSVMLERKMVLKLRVAWKQLDKMRLNRIIRIIIWNKKQRDIGTPERIKRDYGQFKWSFDKELLNNGIISE